LGVERFADLPDDELLALTSREPEAFGAFYERHVRLVMGFLVRATGDAERALDLTAEVFAAALVGAKRFKREGPPASAWLVGIARNKLAAARRGEAIADAARRKLGMPRLGFDDEEIERVVEMLDAGRAGHLDALAELPEAERHAVGARVLDERDYREIAAVEGATQAAIRQRVSRGLAKLARRAREEEG
jgi:RNA polymerase sigma-70 factor, ECF subfamily